MTNVRWSAGDDAPERAHVVERGGEVRPKLGKRIERGRLLRQQARRPRGLDRAAQSPDDPEATYNAKNGSHLKAPQPEGGVRKDSFCARMSGVPGPMKDENGKPTRKAAALKRWKC